MRTSGYWRSASSSSVNSWWTNWSRKQVDHARLELKAVQQQLGRSQRDHAKAKAGFVTQEDHLRAALHSAERRAVHQAGQIKAPEVTLD